MAEREPLQVQILREYNRQKREIARRMVAMQEPGYGRKALSSQEELELWMTPRPLMPVADLVREGAPREVVTAAMAVRQRRQEMGLLSMDASSEAVVDVQDLRWAGAAEPDVVMAYWPYRRKLMMGDGRHGDVEGQVGYVQRMVKRAEAWEEKRRAGLAVEAAALVPGMEDDDDDMDG